MKAEPEFYICTFDKLDIGFMVTFQNTQSHHVTEKVFPLNEAKKAHSYFKNKVWSLGNSNWVKVYIGTKAKTAQKRAEHERALNWLFPRTRTHEKIYRKEGMTPADVFGREREAKGLSVSPE